MPNDDVLILVDKMLGGNDESLIAREIVNAMFVSKHLRMKETNPYIPPHASEFKEGFRGAWRYCFRKSLLQEFYVYEDEEMSPQRIRINEVGWYIHLMLQTLWEKDSNRATPIEIEVTHNHPKYGVFYTIDIVSKFEELFGDAEVVIEIKSMNKRRFEEAVAKTDPKQKHEEAYKQGQIYMFLSGRTKAMGLLFCKDNSDHHEYFFDYDPVFMEPYIERIETRLKLRIIFESQGGLLPKRVCLDQNSKRSEACPVSYLCWMQNRAQRAPYLRKEKVEQTKNASLIHQQEKKGA